MKEKNRPLPRSKLRTERATSQLIAEVKSGQPGAFTRLVHQFRPQVIAVANRLVNDREAALDIAQDVFLKLSRSLDSFDESMRFSTWLHRITFNASVDYLRKQNRHRHDPLTDLTAVPLVPAADPERSYHLRQVERHIRLAASSLNEKQRAAFFLRDVEGCKIDDVATILEMPEATVRWYLHRARKKIRRELTRSCPHLLCLLGIG